MDSAARFVPENPTEDLRRVLRAGVLPEHLRAHVELPAHIAEAVGATHADLVLSVDRQRGGWRVAGGSLVRAPREAPPLATADRFSLIEVD